MGQVRRIMIIGGPGSGKSVLARTLGQKTGLPVVHLDRLFWRPGWVSIPDEDMTAAALTAAQAPRWIIDGNYAATWSYRVSRADLVIVLDLPHAVRMRRILWRTLSGLGRTRPDMAEGCPERFDKAFWSYANSYDQTDRPRLRRLVGACRKRGHPRCVILRNPEAVRWFVQRYTAKFDHI